MANEEGNPAPRDVGLLTVPEAASWLRMGRNHVYEEVRRGALQAVRIGRRVLIPPRALEDYVTRKLDAPP